MIYIKFYRQIGICFISVVIYIQATICRAIDTTLKKFFVDLR